MPRVVKEVNLATKEARKRLAIAKKPYFRSLDEGLHLGYRASNSGGAWVLRWYQGNGKYGTANLEGRPDDVLEADGATVLSWSQAQAAARAQFQRVQREAAGLDEVRTGPYTVNDALTDYMTAYKRRGGKSEDRTQAVIDALIVPALGAIEVAKLSRKRIEAWHEKLTEAAPRLRTKASEEQKFKEADTSPEGLRRRRSTANRVLTILKAALNHVHSARKVASDDAWRGVKSFREVDAARTRYLSDDESRRLVNACDPEFRPLVQAGLLTGARYGEITALIASDFNSDAGTLHIRISKSGKPRHIVLTDEGREFFKQRTTGKAKDALIFTKAGGARWGASHQQRPFNDAVERAKLGKLTFHELRHSYASRLVMSAVPLIVVAQQLGHSDTRMVEKHYGHLAASYIADTVRTAFKSLGVVEANNVKEIGARRAGE
jgi:integrase